MYLKYVAYNPLWFTPTPSDLIRNKKTVKNPTEEADEVRAMIKSPGHTHLLLVGLKKTLE